MVKIIGVRFRSAGKVYYFDVKEFELHIGDHVIVEKRTRRSGRSCPQKRRKR